MKLDNDSHENPSFAFMKLKKEVKGVKYAFIFPKQGSELPTNSLEADLRHLVSFLEEMSSPQKIVITTMKGKIVVYVTHLFVLGAVITRDANPILVEMILMRIVPHLDTAFNDFRTTIMRTLEEKVKKKIESLIPYIVTPVVVTLVLKNMEVEGEIKLTTAVVQKEGEQVKEEIENILYKEIPFFCKKNILIDVITK